MLKGKTPLLIALALAIAAGVVAMSAMEVLEAKVTKGWTLTPVAVAAMAIPEGTVVTPEMIQQWRVPEQFVTSSVVRPEKAEYLYDQKVLVDIQKGDPLLWSQFESTKIERLSTKIQKRFRAITIDASKVASVGGWVRPNDHVDVIGSFIDPKTSENIAVTLLQNVTVLATGKLTGTTNANIIPENQRDYTNVSLLVLPEEAEILLLAAEMGSLVLSLRNEEDADIMDERGHATPASLFSGERKVLREKRKEYNIQILPSSGKNANPKF
jgi:pilus assembly protein CpaB